jgi:two-component sensor histidine kinase
MLKLDSAQAMGVALHELAINAAKQPFLWSAAE